MQKVPTMLYGTEQWCGKGAHEMKTHQRFSAWMSMMSAIGSKISQTANTMTNMICLHIALQAW
jgi:hypothetical protein